MFAGNIKTDEIILTHIVNADKSVIFKYTLKVALTMFTRERNSQKIPHYRITMYQVIENDKDIRVTSSEVLTSELYYHTLKEYDRIVLHMKKGGLRKYGCKVWQEE